MPTETSEPAAAPKPRAYVFFDGQNLFKEAGRQFGVTVPDFCPFRLADLVCRENGWDLRHARFYTGTHTEQQNRRWSIFWANKGRAMKRHRVEFIPRKLQYRTVSIKLYDGVSFEAEGGGRVPCERLYDDSGEVSAGTILTAETFAEKGIDVRIAVDMIRYFDEGEYDVGVVFSRDMDLTEAVDEVRRIAQKRGMKVELASAFPSADPSRRGVPNTRPILISQFDYDRCRDPNTHTYFPK